MKGDSIEVDLPGRKLFYSQIMEVIFRFLQHTI